MYGGRGGIIGIAEDDQPDVIRQRLKKIRDVQHKILRFLQMVVL